MIGRLRGTLVARRPEVVVLEVGGVGYELAVTPRSLAELPSIGEEIVLHTHLHVREDAMTLFGFTDETQQHWFRILLGAPGIGPKVALAMLATMDPEQLLTAIANDDVDALTAVPGIGKRSAQKIVLELKPKVGEAGLAGSTSGSQAAQVREALEQLGYSASEARDVMGSVDPSMPVAEQVRTALKALGRERHA